jgi:hypothetical protein
MGVYDGRERNYPLAWNLHWIIVLVGKDSTSGLSMPILSHLSVQSVLTCPTLHALKPFSISRS